jgi:hypothetical protein
MINVASVLILALARGTWASVYFNTGVVPFVSGLNSTDTILYDFSLPTMNLL